MLNSALKRQILTLSLTSENLIVAFSVHESLNAAQKHD
ncbi:Hypothetical protein BFF96_1305 [Corynebacterium pseudotuberculosis]|nr:Hypothetical protein BFF96_1305 [Corynebacterium pseudotuberculosis]